MGKSNRCIALALIVAGVGLQGCGGGDGGTDAGMDATSDMPMDLGPGMDMGDGAMPDGSMDAPADATNDQPNVVAAPTFTVTVPASPADDNAPHVQGTAPAGSTVTLYPDAACSGLVITSVLATAGGTFDAIAGVVNDTTTTFYATATLAGVTSPCSTSSISYVEDSMTPDPPMLLTTTPASPSSAMMPLFAGMTEADADVIYYGDSSCAGTQLGMTTAAMDGTFSLALTVGADTTTTIYARAIDTVGHVSSCSAGLAYRHDGMMPMVPSFAGSMPSSPANETDPTIRVMAEDGATVYLYLDSACATASIADAVADGTGLASIAVSVGDDTTTTFYADAVDGANNRSDCTVTGFTYVEDSMGPAPPVVSSTTPMGVADDNDPIVSGMAEAGATVEVYTTDDCSGTRAGSDVADGSGDFDVDVTVPDNSLTTFHARAIDVAGNPSACSATSVTYIEQSPGGPPSVSGTITYAGTATGRVYIRVRESCSGCGVIGGTSLAAPGPFLIRGIDRMGSFVLEAWIDSIAVQQVNLGGDPFGQTMVSLSGSPVAGANVVLTDPTPSAPAAPADVQIIPFDGFVSVLWETVRDSFGRDLADSYRVTCSDTLTPGPSDFVLRRTVPGSTTPFAIFNPLAAGTYYCWVEANAGTMTGPPSIPGTITLGMPMGGSTVDGVLTLGNPAPVGQAYVVLFNEAGGIFATRLAAPGTMTPFSIMNVPNNTYELGLLLDRNGDDWLGLFDTMTFNDGGLRQTVTVSGNVMGLDLTIPGGDQVARVTTSLYELMGMTYYGRQIRVTAGSRLPVAVVLTSGIGVSTPVDCGLDTDERGGRFETFRSSTTVPMVGDAYPLMITYIDGSTAMVTPTVTGMFGATPTLTAPVGTIATLTPTFSWTAPVPAPAMYTTELYLYESGASSGTWQVRGIDSSVTSVTYDFDGQATQPALDPATTYNWSITMYDAEGNATRRDGTFTTP